MNQPFPFWIPPSYWQEPPYSAWCRLGGTRGGRLVPAPLPFLHHLSTRKVNDAHYFFDRFLRFDDNCGSLHRDGGRHHPGGTFSQCHARSRSGGTPFLANGQRVV